MWCGSHLVSTEAGTWGELDCYLILGIFVENLSFPDLTQGKAVLKKEKLPFENIKKERLPFEDNNATLEEGLDKWGNVRVFVLFLSQMLTIYHLRF